MGTRLTSFSTKKLLLSEQEGKIVTPRMVEWLDKNSRVPLEPGDEALLHKLFFDKSADIRHGRLGSSSRGTCMRAQIFAYLGAPQVPGGIDYRLANIFIDGQWRHIRWQLMMLKAGVADDVEVTYTDPDRRLKVSVDAIHDAEDYFIEIKGDGTFKDITEPSEAHSLQIHTYFLMTGYSKCVYFVEQKRDQEWFEIVIEPQQKYVEAVEHEIEQLNEAIDEEELPEVLSSCRKKQGPYKKCPYRDICIKATYQDFAADLQEVEIRRPNIQRRLKKRRN